jgi:hypothetical protein
MSGIYEVQASKVFRRTKRMKVSVQQYTGSLKGLFGGCLGGRIVMSIRVETRSVHVVFLLVSGFVELVSIKGWHKCSPRVSFVAESGVRR